MRNDGGPAYPALDFIHSKDLPPESVHRLGTTRGMSLRDWFAGQALPSMLSCKKSELFDSASQEEVDLDLTLGQFICKRCYDYADLMLAERDRHTNQGD